MAQCGHSISTLPHSSSCLRPQCPYCLSAQSSVSISPSKLHGRSNWYIYIYIYLYTTRAFMVMKHLVEHMVQMLQQLHERWVGHNTSSRLARTCALCSMPGSCCLCNKSVVCPPFCALDVSTSLHYQARSVCCLRTAVASKLPDSANLQHGVLAIPES